MSSTFLGLTSCPYLLPLALCRLPLLVPTPRQLPLLLSTIPSSHEHYQSLEHIRSLEYHSTSNSVSIIPPRIAYSTFYHLCVDYSFVSTTSPRVNYCLTSGTPYINIFRQYGALLKISTISTGYGLQILGRFQLTHSYAIRDSGPKETGGGNFGHASPKSGLLMVRIGSSIVSRTLRTFDPANG